MEAKDVSDSQLTTTKIQSGVPADLQTCHTARVGGYIVEGHVPAEDIQRLLKEKPAFAGLAVAGMPMGSPGMPGPKIGTFTIYAVAKDGAAPTVYATE